MPDSRHLAGLIGPVLMAIVAAEFPLVQPDLYAQQTPPVVYLSGVLAFVAGLAIVRAHNRWAADWTVLITLTGWAALALGLVRMFAAGRYQHATAHTSPSAFMLLEAALFAAGLVMTVMAWRRERPR